MNAAGLPRDLLDLLVEVDRVLLQLGDIGIAVDRVHATGGVPGRARGQLVAFDQHDVAPAGLRQMIEDAGTDDAAADDGGLDMLFHSNSFPVLLVVESVRLGRQALWRAAEYQGLANPYMMAARIYGGFRVSYLTRGPRSP